MLTIRISIPLVLAGLLAAASAESPPVFNPAGTRSPTAKPSVSHPPVSQQLPDVIDADSRVLLERGEFDRARLRCESMIESSALVAEPGVLAGPYLCLAEALFALKNNEGAALAYTNAIDQLERSSGVFDPRLVRPLEGLGKTLMRLGKFDAAEEALVQAKDLTHRNFGIYNLVQSSIVNRLTKTYYSRRDFADASREQNFLLRAHEENYGEAPQLLPAIRRMAKWHERTGRYDLARNNYRRALKIMLRAYGPNDLRLVGPMRDFARSYMTTPRGANRVMSRSGANALMDVIDLYERQEFTDAVDVARSWGELGDWYVVGGRRGAARKAYGEAGKILQSAAGDDASKGSDLFSRPVEIEYEDVPIGVRPSRLQSLPDGIAILEFEFTVNAEGRVRGSVAVVRDDLKYPSFAFRVVDRIKASRYRPRIVNGQPVATKGVRKILRYDLTRRLPSRSRETAAGSGDAQNQVDGSATPAEAPESQPSESPESDAESNQAVDHSDSGSNRSTESTTPGSDR